MENKLNWEEIKKQYDQEWLLLEDYDWPDEEVDPRAGRVRFHAPTRTEFDCILEQNEALLGTEVAIVYTGRPLITQGFRGGFGDIEIVGQDA